MCIMSWVESDEGEEESEEKEDKKEDIVESKFIIIYLLLQLILLIYFVWQLSLPSQQKSFCYVHSTHTQ